MTDMEQGEKCLRKLRCFIYYCIIPDIKYIKEAIYKCPCYSCLKVITCSIICYDKRQFTREFNNHLMDDVEVNTND